MKNLALSIALLASVFSSSATWAAGQMCLELFREAGSVEATEGFRAHLMDRANWLMQNLEKQEQDDVKIAVDFLKDQSRVSNSTIQAWVQSSKTLATLTTLGTKTAEDLGIFDQMRPPEVKDHTVSAIQDQGLNKAELESVLAADPYFIWLKHNALKFLVPPEQTQSFVRELLGRGNYQPEPAKLFTMYRDQGLPPALAILRLQRNLDPTWAPYARAAVDRALAATARMNAIDERILASIGSIGNNGGKREAWLLMPSAAAGRANLNKIKTRLLSLYSDQFSENAFDRLHIAARRYDPAVLVVEEFRVARVMKKSDEEIVKDFGPQIEALRTKIGASAKISAIRLLEVSLSSLSNRQNGTYVYVLADVFESPIGQMPNEGRPTNVVSAQLIQLQNLVEIADGLATLPKMSVFAEEISRDYVEKFKNISAGPEAATAK